MRKAVKKIYEYYTSECEKYKAYKKKWKHIGVEHFMAIEVYENKKDWRTGIHAIEKALNLTEKEKINI